MPPKFGTSGLRGLVVALTPELVAAHVQAFLVACPVGTGLYVGRDLRLSSPDIAQMVIDTAAAAGVDVVDCGDVPTPALALAAMQAGAGAVMITGSHIPADRNGLKFYTPMGEISKTDEAGILAALGQVRHGVGAVSKTDAGPAYVARYVDAFGPDALAGMRVGAYTHSTVGRDLMIDVLTGLGADVTELGRSDVFIPVDTEAVPEDVRAQLRDWAPGLDAIMSMDGDGDRPLLTDEAGEVVPGDILGQITAKLLGAKVVVTPVSSNTAVSNMGFERVINTRIGSPFVIAGMDGQGDCVGYEANGGFLLGFEAHGLGPLMTRDSLLPIIAPLVAAKGQGVAALVASQPARFTAADRLQEIPTDVSAALVAKIDTDPGLLLGDLGLTLDHIDRTDGVRMICDGAIVHLRPSGNAPELRLYVEADSKARCQDLLGQGLLRLNALK
jgi:phosphomannomutase